MDHFDQHWHYRFMEMAKLCATWSKDRTKVGAVIVRPDKTIASTGYNGLPKGLDDSLIINNREWKNKRILHAEMNAIANAHSDIRGCILYVTHPPCNDCAKHMASFGIAAVYCMHDERIVSNWSCDVSLDMFAALDIGIYEVDIEQQTIKPYAPTCKESLS